MTGFLLNLLASLLAAIIFVIGAAVLSRQAREILTAIASTFLHVEVKYVFGNGKEAERSIKETLKKGREIRIFTGRGNAFQRDLYQSALEGKVERKRHVRILLPSPHSAWVDYREVELAKIDPQFGEGTLRRQIETVLGILRKFIEQDRFEVRLYDLPHLGRIILTEDSLYMTPYSDSVHGRDCRVYLYGRGDTYDMYSRFFEMAWQKSEALTRQIA